MTPRPDDDSWLAPGVSAEPGAMRLQFSRGGGPGGQNVNKLNTRAELWLKLDGLRGMSHAAIQRLRHLAGSRLTDAGEIHLLSQVERTQESNRADVMDRLRRMIVEAMVEPKLRRKTRPSAGARRRRLESKRQRSQIKSQRRGEE
jgi:ribosome-associated protein